MKRFWSLFLAAVFVAAGIAPAIAADVEMSGEVRVRHENKNNYSDQSDTTGDRDSKTTQRTRLNAKVAIDDQTTGYISIQDARTWGEEASTATTANETDNVDLSKAWLQIANVAGTPLTLKIGRQALAYGNHRVIGSFEWSDNARRFDAIKLLYKSEAVDVDVFFADIGNQGAGNADDHLNGIYAVAKTLIPANTLDLYILQKTTTGEVDFNTIGARLAGKAAGFDWTAEFATQSGDASATTDQDADAWAATVNYAVTDTLKIGAEAFAGDGDDPSTSDNEAFDNLYPTNHFHFGISDFGIGGEGQRWGDIEGFAVKAKFKAPGGVKLGVDYWTFETEQSGDDIGDEIDVHVKYGLTEKVKLYLYASQFSPDKESFASDDDVEKVGLQLHAKF